MCIEITYSLFLPPWRAACRLMRGTGARHCDDPDFVCSGILSGMFHERPSSPALTPYPHPLAPSERGEGRRLRQVERPLSRRRQEQGLRVTVREATPGTLL